MPDYFLLAGSPAPTPGVCVLSVSSTPRGDIEVAETQVISTDVGPSWINASPVNDNRLLFAYSTGLRLYGISNTNDGVELRNLSDFMPNGSKGFCHATFSNDGRYIFAADYKGGKAGSYSIKEDVIAQEVTALSYEGSGGYKVLQDASHAHWARQHPSRPYVYITNLGTDKVYVYNLCDNGGLVHASEFTASPATGPRHIAFHPSGRVLYILGEVSGQVLTCTINEDDGSLEAVSSASSLPLEDNGPTAGHNREDGSRGMHTAEILVTRDGKNLYVSHRNQRNVSSDKIAILNIDDTYPYAPHPDTLRFADAGGMYVRGMALNPFDEGFIATANQRSGSIGILKRDTETGDLTLAKVQQLSEGHCPTSLVWRKPLV